MAVVIIIVLSIILAFINMSIDSRSYILGFITLFATIFGLGTLFLVSGEKNTKYVFLWFGIILLNFIITIIMRRIPAIERPSFKKTSIFSLAGLYAFVVYSDFDSISTQSTSEIIYTLFILLFVALILYFVLREFLFVYLLLWIDYFFATSIVYENKKVHAVSEKYKSRCHYYWVLVDEKIELKPSNELIKKYYKNNESRMHKRTMKIKRGIISKRLIVVEVK